MFTGIQHETGYESAGELVHPRSVLKQTCDDFKDKTDTFVKVAMQFFSKGCAWQKELCENVISILFTMITYRGKLREVYSEYQGAGRCNVGAPETSKY